MADGSLPRQRKDEWTCERCDQSLWNQLFCVIRETLDMQGAEAHLRPEGDTLNSRDVAFWNLAWAPRNRESFPPWKYRLEGTWTEHMIVYTWRPEKNKGVKQMEEGKRGYPISYT